MAIDPGTPGRTLGDLFAALNPEYLSAVCTPRGLDRDLHDVVIIGVDESVPPSRAGLLILVGGRPTQPNTLVALHRAAELGYTAVIIKQAGQDLSALVEAAESVGVAVLVTPDDTSWRHLVSLLAALTGEKWPGTGYGSVDAGDLFSLANAIAASVGGAVSIETPHGHVLAYSNLADQRIDERRTLAILGRETPERPQNAGEYQKIMGADKPVQFSFPDSDVATRLAVAIRAGNETLGVIFALDLDPPLGPGAADALADAADIAALHLLRARMRRDPERWVHTEAARGLLDGSLPPAFAATQLRLTVDTPTTILAVGVTRTDDVPPAAWARILDLVSLYTSSWDRHAVSAAAGEVIYAVLPTRGDVAAARWRRLAEDILSTLHRSTGLHGEIAIGPLACRLDEVPAARRLADVALGILGDDPAAPRVALVEHMTSQILLRELASHGYASSPLLPGPAQRIMEFDRVEKTSHADTLLAYLNASGSAPAAARLLHLHENTLRYRIRRVEEIFGVRLDDPDERLMVWLQLRLARDTAAAR